jgi:hypothetical protein
VISLVVAGLGSVSRTPLRCCSVETRRADVDKPCSSSTTALLMMVRLHTGSSHASHSLRRIWLLK